MILYSIIIFGYDVSTDNISCIDRDIMDFDSETLFRSSVCDVMPRFGLQCVMSCCGSYALISAKKLTLYR